MSFINNVFSQLDSGYVEKNDFETYLYAFFIVDLGLDKEWVNENYNLEKCNKVWDNIENSFECKTIYEANLRMEKTYLDFNIFGIGENKERLIDFLDSILNVIALMPVQF